MNIICLAPAGGSAIQYFKWKKYCANDLNIIPLEYKGRGFRENEAYDESLNDMVKDIFNHITKYTNDEYMIFAHSMGCTIAYEIYRLLLKEKYNLPKHVFFAAGDIPENLEKSDIYELDEISFRKEANKYGSDLESLSFDLEFQNKMYDVLRNDLRLVNKHCFDGNYEKLKCDITVIHGIKDKTCDINARWDKYTEKNCYYHYINGEHFFPFNQIEETINVIKNEINIECFY